MTEVRRLFDQLERNDSSPASYNESSFDALNRLSWKSTGAIRQVLEKWYFAYPDQHKKQFHKRFRSRTHQGAFFELVLFRLLTQLGCNVDVNPKTTEGKTPDFLAALQSGEKFYIEATVVEPITFQDSPSEKVVFDQINKLHCPNFWLVIKPQGALTSIPSLQKIKAEIQGWIDELNYEEVKAIWDTNQQLPTFSLSHEQWTLKIEALPKSPDMKGRAGARPIGLGPMRIEHVNSAKPIRDAIHKKARKYRDVGLSAPIIVAVNALDRAGVDRIDLLLALFGWEASTGNSNISRIAAPKDIRREDWLWDTNKNNRVSAVLLFDELQPNTMAVAKFCMYENPWASHPVPASLRCLPHAIVEGDFLRWYQGQALRDILDLPADWPGPKK